MKYILPVVAIFFIPVFSKAQEKSAKNLQMIENTILNVFNSISNRDSVTLKSLCTSDLLVLENGELWNLDTLICKISQNKSPDFKRINRIDFIDVKVNGNIAWTTYNNQAEVTRNGKYGLVKWLETAILIRENKTWKLKVLHSTLLKRG